MGLWDEARAGEALWEHPRARRGRLGCGRGGWGRRVDVKVEVGGWKGPGRTEWRHT